MLNIQDIQNILPHRYPFLLVDRILEIDEDNKKVVGIKNVTINEPFFQGHFPGFPVMPGVLIIEAMAQVAGCALLKAASGQHKLVYLTGVDNARFRKPVVPGDQLHMEISILKIKGTIGKVEAKATVDGQLVAEAEIMFALAS